ncbi:MAG: sigma-70 family RNA polymerase sigma factor [Novosphingobium sp.]|uniref:sigma-70 family RNA polymerase sigma factor n=1 Tax=Novosphingobium sp. TaxID=1874826 RepID=UPI00262CFE43|nr:sigma-70 family RNA polymerase sigma factor [Novosphingobium sp.]MCP5385489.1 sigma-70 family RNA polymerase sigma factor [Novosphingobium sp.]
MIADEATLARLAGLAQRGDKQAYAALLGAARSWLLRFYRRRVLPAQIEDLVQDTLLSVHRKLASYDPLRPFTPWLAAIARYRFVDHLRQVYRAEEQSLDHDLPVDSEEEAIAARVSLERLFAALPEAQSRAIELVKIEGRSIAEASQSTGQSESLVKVNIHRGLKRLAAMIERA